MDLKDFINIATRNFNKEDTEEFDAESVENSAQLDYEVNVANSNMKLVNLHPHNIKIDRVNRRVLIVVEAKDIIFLRKELK